MIIILKEGYGPDSPGLDRLRALVGRFPGVSMTAHSISGAVRSVTEVYLLGDTSIVPIEALEGLTCIERVFRVSQKYKQIGRHEGQAEARGWVYQGLTFDQSSFHIFLGQCSADTPAYVEQTFRAVREAGVTTSRIGAYKPRTSPYDFQGHGRECLPWVFELAGKHGIRILSMEVCEERHIDEITEELERAGRPTGVLLQIGTRNAQNFALLKAVGRQHEFPVLYKRGMGITITESLNACEYIASEGNHRIIFCLRGVKSSLGEPHRNFADFVHIPVVKQLTRLPVCADPSHAVGKRTRGGDGLLDIFHASAQSVIVGANLVMTETHPEPSKALSDGPQALLLHELQHYVEDLAIARQAYEARLELRGKYRTEPT